MGRIFQEHIDNLKEVLERLSQAGLRRQPKKCHLAQQKVPYLGYVISSFGISVDTSKVEAVNSFPIPKSLKQLCSYVGLASYYCRFIQGFSRIASPLFMLIKKHVPYVCSSDCQKAFDELKDCLTKAPVHFP